jgi:hypothetical protein
MGTVWPPSHHASRDARGVDARIAGADEEDAYEIAALLGAREKVDLRGCREHRLERDAGTCREQLLASRIGPARGRKNRLGGIPVAEPVTRDLVRVQVLDAFAPAFLAEPRRHGRLASAVRTGDDEEGRLHVPSGLGVPTPSRASASTRAAAISARSFAIARSCAPRTPANARAMRPASCSSVGSKDGSARLIDSLIEIHHRAWGRGRPGIPVGHRELWQRAC